MTKRKPQPASTAAEIERIRRAITDLLYPPPTDNGEPAQARSLRGLAAEVGMSPSGLKKFVGGADPYAPTLRDLRLWYAAFQAGDLDARMKVAINALVRQLPESRQERALQEFTELAKRFIDEVGYAAPRAPTAGNRPKRYTVLTERCGECPEEVVSSRMGQHLWQVHRIRSTVPKE